MLANHIKSPPCGSKQGEWYFPLGFVSGDVIFLSAWDLMISVKPPLFTVVKH